MYSVYYYTHIYIYIYGKIKLLFLLLFLQLLQIFKPSRASYKYFKSKLAKLVQRFTSFSEIEEQQLILLMIDKGILVNVLRL